MKTNPINKIKCYALAAITGGVAGFGVYAIYVNNFKKKVDSFEKGKEK